MEEVKQEMMADIVGKNYSAMPMSYQELNKYNTANNKLEHYFRTRANQLISLYEMTFHVKRNKAWKDYTLDKSERASRLEKRKMYNMTNMFVPLVKMFVDIMYNTIYDTNFDITARARKKSNVNKANTISNFATWCFSSESVYSNFMNSIKESVSCGPGYGRASFNISKELITYKKLEAGENPITRSMPVDNFYATLEYISIFEMFYAPDEEFDTADKLIRKIIPSRKAKKTLQLLLGDKFSEDMRLFTLNSPNRIRDENFDAVKLSSFSPVLQGDLFSISNSDLYKIKDGHNPNVERCEGWIDGNKLVIMVNGYIWYDGVNPIGDEDPFYMISYEDTPGYSVPKGVAITMSDTQDIYNAIVNSFMDSVKMAISPMFIAEGTWFLKGEEGVLNYEPWNIIQNIGQGRLTQLELGKVDQNVFQVLEYLMGIAMQTEGPNRYSGGGGEGIERSALGARLQSTSTLQKLKPILKSISRAATKCVRIWMKQALMMMPPKFTISILGEGNNQNFIDISLEDLKGYYDIEFKTNSVQSLKNIMAREEMFLFLQGLQNAATDPVTGEYLLNQKEIVKKITETYDFDGSVMLASDKFYENREAAEKNKINLYAELEKYKQQLMPQSNPNSFQQEENQVIDTAEI